MSHNKENMLNNGCFDLHFRKDVKRDRLNQPTYYRWKAQFVLTSNFKEIKLLEKIRNILNCGHVYSKKNEVRFVVQNVAHLYNFVIPFLKSYQLSKRKKSDFELWAKAVGILHKNKRKKLANWKKNDFQQIMEIRKRIKGYKQRPKKIKWLSVAESIASSKSNYFPNLR